MQYLRLSYVPILSNNGALQHIAPHFSAEMFKDEMKTRDYDSLSPLVFCGFIDDIKLIFHPNTMYLAIRLLYEVR